MKEMPFLKKAGNLGFSLLVIVIIFLVVGLFMHGMVWASEKALPWLVEAGQISFAICGFAFLPLCVFRKTRPWAGLGFFVASYVFGTELLAYSCIVAFAIWGYAGLVVGLLFAGIGVVPVALLAALYAAARHQTQWGLSGDLAFMILVAFSARLLGIYLSTPKHPQELESKVTLPKSPSFFKEHRVLPILGWLLAIFSLGWILKSYSGLTVVKSPPLSPAELFRRVSPSVFVVEALGANGETAELGSGVAIGPNLLITNCHVVQNGSALRVRRGKETWNGRLIQADSTHDLCGLRPSGLSLSPVNVRPSSDLATGERVYAIGAPEGLELTFSEGIISALRESEGVHMIQTSAPISPGSSGGGLFDTQGNLVGVTTFFLKEGQSLNFALPGEWIRGMLTDIIKDGTSSGHRSDAELESRAWLQIGLEAVKKEDYELAGYSFRRCAELKKSDASRAWLEIGNLAERAAFGFKPTSDAYNAWFRKSQLSPVEAQELAIVAFEKAIEFRPDYAEAWQELASDHRLRKEYGQAIAAAKEATRLAPREWRGWEILGDCYIQTESYAEAIEALQQGEKVAPDMEKWIVLEELGVAYAKKGDRGQVLRIYRELKTSHPEDAETFFREYILPPTPPWEMDWGKQAQPAPQADKMPWERDWSQPAPPTGTAICSTVGADGRRVFMSCPGPLGETQEGKPQQ